jgi:ribosomal peptide maturation radical SAM protein 1
VTGVCEPIAVPDLSSIGKGDALIIVPPFASLELPSLGAHLLQACAKGAGLDVRLLYANLVFAASFSEETYDGISCGYQTTAELIGERFFAAAAYGRPPLALPMDGSYDQRFSRAIADFEMKLSLTQLRALEVLATDWVERVGASVARLGFPVVGVSTTFEQTAAAVALLAAVKRRCPETITIVGGANCEGPMADGIVSLDAPIDYVFSGQSEETFVDWLLAVKAGVRPPQRIIKGRRPLDMNGLPPPNYQSWFAQRALFLNKAGVVPKEVYVMYESSRGCWWGEKHHCTFCGLNGLGMRYSEKSADKVIEDLRYLLAQSPTRNVQLTDNIMPYRYFHTLLPRLQGEVPGVRLFYEEKSNLSLEKIQILKQAGVVSIQPGIEAISTPLLQLMDKGVTAAQNVALLRYARSVGVEISWNLLFRFPGDKVQDYEQTLTLIPLLRHLPPPDGFGPLRIDRFSPYHERPERHGLVNLRPLPAYAHIFPPGARIDLIAYNFLASYESAANDKVEAELRAAVTSWQALWRTGSKPPALHVRETRPGAYLLIDTRGLPGARTVQFLDTAQARAALVPHKPRSASANETSALTWALAERVAVHLDGRHVPLATASATLLARFEAETDGAQGAEEELGSSDHRLVRLAGAL